MPSPGLSSHGAGGMPSEVGALLGEEQWWSHMRSHSPHVAQGAWGAGRRAHTPRRETSDGQSDEGGTRCLKVNPLSIRQGGPRAYTRNGSRWDGPRKSAFNSAGPPMSQEDVQGHP